MGLMSRLRKRPDERGPAGVAVKVRPSARPAAPEVERRSIPRTLFWGMALATLFYLGAHYSIVQGVWPVHGTAPRSGAVLMRDGAALLGWLTAMGLLRYFGYRGNWAVVALPVIIFFLTRPTQFQIFTDPVYQATSGTRARANTLKAERSQLTTIARAYDEERQQMVFGGAAPETPDPIEAMADATRPERSSIGRIASSFSVFLAPLVLVVGYLLSRRPAALRWFRENRLWPFVPTMVVFFTLTLFFTQLGKVGGMTPWELFLPILIGSWAATLGDDAYNLARPGEVIAPRRILSLLVFGALPVVPFLIIRELGLSIVLAGSMATMLLVGTRRGWWAMAMLGVWAVLVFAAFQVDERSATRLALAIDPYRDVSSMTDEQAEQWGAKVHQMKLFDANVLAGGVFGEGPGRGHAETAPNSADDGYITGIAAQWGLLGALALVLLYTAFVVQMLSVAVRERSAFERSLVTGLAMLIGIPFWLATLGGIRVIPLTGVAAAFAAAGGAKLLASSLAVGIVAGISHRRSEADRLEAASGSHVDHLGEKGVRIR